ncbi:MAG: hypothetical protein KTR25_20170 [Myxococcales bacterium]|nr:hypothetical protein [Myxococcales bacterium]
MNEKTAKLLRKYTKVKPEVNLNNLKREWHGLDQFERRDLRIRLQEEIAAAPTQPADSSPSQEEA